MSLAISKQQELEQTLETLKTKQRELAHRLASENGNESGINNTLTNTLSDLLEVQTRIKTVEQALGIVNSAVQAFNAASAKADRNTFLTECVAARATAINALQQRQTAAAAVDGAIAALASALDQLSTHSETARLAFEKWRAGVRSVGAGGDDPWMVGLGYVHPDLHWFAATLAQRLDEVLRTRIKVHPHIAFNYTENKVLNTIAAANTDARTTFAAVTGAAHARLQAGAASA